jgi:hypothetical protein
MGTAIRVVFMPSTGHVRFSVPTDVGLNIERAIAFVDALLRQAGLASSKGSYCTVYYPKAVKSLWITSAIEKSDVEDFRARWKDILVSRFGDGFLGETRYVSQRRAYDLTLVPGWALSYKQVAACMFPALVWSILSKLDLSEAANIDEVRHRTEQEFPGLASRDVWSPYAWAVALKADISIEDLVFASHPPSEQYELE